MNFRLALAFFSVIGIVWFTGCEMHTAESTERFFPAKKDSHQGEKTETHAAEHEAKPTPPPSNAVPLFPAPSPAGTP